MKQVFVIRFARNVITTPLYLTTFKGEAAFHDDIQKCLGWRSKQDAEKFLKIFLGQQTDLELKERLTRDLSVEEHVFGDKKH